MFTQYLEEPCHELVDQALEEGLIPIGYTCSLVPAALLSLPPLFPLRMRAPGVGGTEVADIYMSNLTCSYTRSLLEFALDFRYDFLGGWVNTASCDHLRRLHDNLEYLSIPGFSHLLDIPHRAGEQALAWFTEELQGLAEKLRERFEVDISEANLRQAVQDHNDFLALLSSIGELRRQKAPPLTGTDFHKMLTAAQASPPGLIRDKIIQYRDQLAGQKGLDGFRARLMVVGGQLDDPRYIETIESAGGLVVADRFCTGSIPGLKPITLGNQPVLSALAEDALLTPSCPRMMEDFDARLAQITTAAEEYQVDGIIVEFIKFCDTWGVETAALVPALREAGYRVMCLEREYSGTGAGQLQTRVQAFLESMGL